MSLSNVARMMCMRHPLGVRGIAAQMRTHDGRPMNEDVLRNKLDPNQPHQLYANEAEQITAITGYPDLALELCTLLKLVPMPLPAESESTADDVMGGMAKVAREFSALMNEFSAAVADNKISPNESERFKKRFIELFIAGIHAVALMDGKAANREPVVRLVPGAGA